MKFNRLQVLLHSLILGLTGVCFVSDAANITSTTFTISGVLEAKTCTFVEKTRTIQLPEVDTKSLAHNSVYGTTSVAVSLNCPAGVSVVSIIPSGTAVESGDTTLFKNTGTAKNVGLRLFDNSNNVMRPDGETKATFNPDTTAGVYVFKAGYAGTGTGRVSGGSFAATITLSLDYS
ncbi:fimbrial protein [Enterobacter hormaechei]